MASPGREVEGHYDQARHNEAVLDYLMKHVIPERPDFADWVLIVMHYAAFHYTKAKILRDFDADVKIHRSRRGEAGEVEETGHNELVSDCLGEDVGVAYRELYFRGQEVRYRPFFKMWSDPAKALQELRLQKLHLDTIRAACTP